MKAIIAAVLALLASPVSSAIVPLDHDVCIRHGDLTETAKAEGYALLGRISLPDGRRFDEYYKSATGEWLAVIVWRPSGWVSASSCAMIFAVSELGVFLPTMEIPVWP